MAYNRNNFFNALNKSSKIVDENKKAKKDKRSETLEKYKSIAEMQSFIDKSEEKRALLLDVAKNTIDIDTNKKLIEKGVVVYIKLLEVVALVEEDFTKAGINFKTITGAVSAQKRMKIVDWFNEDCTNRVLIISDAGGESINIKKTNLIILYNVPQGYRSFIQIIGRVCRGNFDNANVHLIQIENSLDCYFSELISSKKELEMELLHCDNIPLKSISSFNSEILKKIKKDKLWHS